MKKIEGKVNNIVNAVFVKKDEFLTSFCCDYLKLQALCDQWKYKIKQLKIDIVYFSYFIYYISTMCLEVLYEDNIIVKTRFSGNMLVRKIERSS